jgi:hypothetical protein
MEQVDAEHHCYRRHELRAISRTWNCRHLANPVIHRSIARACEVEGFCPEICTPEQLMARRERPEHVE